MPSPEGEATTGGGVDVSVMDRPAVPVESAPAAEAPAELPTPDVDQLAETMVRWQHLGVLGRGGSARIRLSPPELGSVEVALRTAGNVVRVHVTVQSESVQQLLDSNSDRLVQSLQTQGLQAGRVEVVVQTPADQGAEQGDYQGADQGADQGQARRQRQGGSQGQQSQQQSRTFASEMQDEVNVTA
jgi:flagellar hook-length control protein FliK